MPYVEVKTSVVQVNAGERFAWKFILNPDGPRGEIHQWGGIMDRDSSSWLEDMEASVMYIRQEYEKWKANAP